MNQIAWCEIIKGSLLKKYIKGGSKWYEQRFEPRYRKEWYQFIPNMTYMEDLHIPDAMRIILVSASDSEWFDAHEEILKGHENSMHVEMEGGHYIHLRHPERILGYIRELCNGPSNLQ